VKDAYPNTAEAEISDSGNLNAAINGMVERFCEPVKLSMAIRAIRRVFLVKMLRANAGRLLVNATGYDTHFSTSAGNGLGISQRVCEKGDSKRSPWSG